MVLLFHTLYMRLGSPQRDPNLEAGKVGISAYHEQDIRPVADNINRLIRKFES